MKTEDDALYPSLCTNTDIKPSVVLPKQEPAEYETAEDVKPCFEAASSDITDTDRHDEQKNLPPSQGTTAATKPTHCLREYLRLLSQDYVCECELCQKPRNKPMDMSDDKTCEDQQQEIHLEVINKDNIQKRLTNGKIYECDLCDYKTNKGFNLRKHKIVHTKEMRHKCKVCNFMTRTTQFFAKHKKEHCYEYSYTCKWCDFKTTNRPNLKEHKKTHKEMQYICTLCNFMTNSSVIFGRHKNEHLFGVHPSP